MNDRAVWDLHSFPQEWTPDKLRNYEMGWRSTFASNRVRVNATFFYMDWQDFQTEFVDPVSGDCYDDNDPGQGTGSCWDMVTVLNGEITAQVPDRREDQLPWISIVGNLGDAHMTGLTAEGDWIATDRFSLGGNFQWLAEAEIDTINNVTNDANLVPGLDLPNAPEFQGAAWATYTWPVNWFDNGSIFLRGQYSWTDETLSRLVPAPLTDPNPQFTTDSYGIGDVRLGLTSGDGKWESGAGILGPGCGIGASRWLTKAWGVGQ